MRHSKKLICVALLATLPQIVSADVWQEQELLERWIVQIESLDEILDEAQSSADVNSRSQLNYSVLKTEVHQSLLKVKHYLNAPTVPFDQFEQAGGINSNDN